MLWCGGDVFCCVVMLTGDMRLKRATCCKQIDEADLEADLAEDEGKESSEKEEEEEEEDADAADGGEDEVGPCVMTLKSAKQEIY